MQTAAIDAHRARELHSSRDRWYNNDAYNDRYYAVTEHDAVCEPGYGGCHCELCGEGKNTSCVCALCGVWHVHVVCWKCVCQVRQAQTLR